MPHPALEYLNTAIALATFPTSEGLRSTVENVQAYFARFGGPPELTQQFEQDDEIRFVQLLVIDQDLLDDLTDKMGEVITNERKCVRRASRAQERDACMRRAERDVCDNVNYIRDRNDGDMPTDYLKDIWTSYGCVRV